MTRVFWLLLLPALAVSQPMAPQRSFEAVSIKPHDGPMLRLGVTTSGLRLTADASNAAMLVMYAYNLQGFQLAGAAPLLQDYNARWDIFAKAEGDSKPTTAEFRAMLRALLAERFQLQLHREMRVMPVYALFVGKNGPKLKASAPDAETYINHHLNGRVMEVTFTKAGMRDIVDAIGNAFLDRPVVDRTGLNGTYDGRLSYTPDTAKNRAGGASIDDLDLFQMVQAQLGLKLEARKLPIEILVVDRVERPSPD